MSKCVICFREHNRLWFDNKPAMYCEECARIKNDSAHVVSQIFDNLYLSGIIAASAFTQARLCVHEDTPTYEGSCIHIPILVTKPNSVTDRTGALASLEALDCAADVIAEYVDSGIPLLVHCKGGVERSPLTIAWYLVRSKRMASLEDAYTFLKSKRSVVSERLFWLPCN